MSSTSDTYTIQRPSAEHVDALVSLMNELGYSMSRETMETQLNCYIESDRSIVFIASAETNVFGAISGHLIPALHQPGNIGRITSMVVAFEARSQGVGSALLQKLEDWFRSNNCLRFEVTSGDNREVAHKFYESHGYVFDERRFLKHPM
jgi:GNAT superfamily N-acetyltransferase